MLEEKSDIFIMNNQISWIVGEFRNPIRRGCMISFRRGFLRRNFAIRLNMYENLLHFVRSTILSKSVPSLGRSCLCYFSCSSLAQSFRNSFHFQQPHGCSVSEHLLQLTQLTWHGTAWLRMIFQYHQGWTGQYWALPCSISVSTRKQDIVFRWSAVIFRPSTGQELPARAHF